MTDLKQDICPACGSPFQNDDPDMPGFLPSSAERKAGTICRRCFRLVHYGQVAKAPLNDEAVIAQLRPASLRASGIVLLVDPTAMEFSRRALNVAKGLHLPLIAVVTKTDLFDRWMDRKELVSWISRQWDLPRERLIALSLLDSKALFDLRARLPKLFGHSYRLLVMGVANAGKSTFIRGISRRGKELALSPLPGTTLGCVDVPVGQEGLLIDSPGLRLGNFWIPRLCPSCLSQLVSRHKLSRKTFILHREQSLMFGGLAYGRIVDCADREWVKVTAFASSEIPLHRTKAGREEELLERHSGALLSVPCPSCLATLRGSYPLAEYRVTLHRGEDLVLPGCGWLACYQGEAAFSLFLPEGFAPEIRPWFVAPFLPRNQRRR